jgi:cobalt-zinc-cadmium resistance protein CzcA
MPSSVRRVEGMLFLRKGPARFLLPHRSSSIPAHDRLTELRRGGTPMAEAIREGAILRLRPIMMTALVAALGLLPAALATGVGTDSQRPFALVIVSGLFSRLLISIFLMPVLYAIVAREGDRLEV